MSERTVSHLEGGPLPQGTRCKDCDINAWRQWDTGQQTWVHEDFYVHDDLWNHSCPDDIHVTGVCADGSQWRNGTFVLCIGCFEQRLGRKLTAQDFKPEQEPDGWYWRELVGRPSSARFRDRLSRTL